ncbi:hypothetical protein Tco_1196238, partial [Tanacetum coccineum]
MGTPSQVYVLSCPNFSAPAGRPFSCSSNDDEEDDDVEEDEDEEEEEEEHLAL